MMGTAAWSQDPYPSKPVRLIVPFAAGGATDVVGRLFGKELGDVLGQPVVIENRVGATGRIGAEAVARSKPDGYTLLLATTSTHAVLPALSASMTYDAVKDFTRVIKIGETPVILVASTALPFGTVQELVAYAKKNPGKLTYASSGIGSILHLAGELFARSADISMLHVPYKGDAPALVDMGAGTVDIMFSPTPGPGLATKRVKAIASASKGRNPLMPDLPTVSEGGIPDFALASWIGMMAPAGTLDAVVRRLNRVGNDILARPDFRKRLADLNYIPVAGSTEAFDEAQKADIARFKSLNIKLD
jgi:tripartite-type tricarboxylate transporter receptor subunit TctC